MVVAQNLVIRKMWSLREAVRVWSLPCHVALLLNQCTHHAAFFQSPQPDAELATEYPGQTTSFSAAYPPDYPAEPAIQPTTPAEPGLMPENEPPPPYPEPNQEGSPLQDNSAQTNQLSNHFFWPCIVLNSQLVLTSFIEPSTFQVKKTLVIQLTILYQIIDPVSFLLLLLLLFLLKNK